MERTWPKKNRPIMAIDIPFFEHLLSCMATQKFIGDLLPEEQEANQEVIDDAWGAGMILLDEAKEEPVFQEPE